MSNEKGFTLVSVMVAIVMTAVGLLGLLSTQVASYSLGTHANARTAAVSVARAYMEEIKARDPRTLGSLPVDPQWVGANGEPSESGVYKRSVEISSGGDHLKEVKVKVLFPKATQPVELVTLVYHQTF